MKYFFYLILFSISTVSSAQVFTVTSSADAGTGSLRWAIDQANNFGAAEQKTINFDLGCCDTTIFLFGEGLSILTSNLVINGLNSNGSKVTLDGCEFIIGFSGRVLSEGLVFGAVSIPPIFRENLEVNNLRFRSFHNAITFQFCNDIRVLDCEFAPGCVDDGEYNSITTNQCNSGNFSSNHFSTIFCNQGVLIPNSSAQNLSQTQNVLIEDNVIIGYDTGIRLSSCETIRIFSNRTCVYNCFTPDNGNNLFIDNIESQDVIIGGDGLENYMSGNILGIRCTFDGTILARENSYGNIESNIINYTDDQLSTTYVTTTEAGGLGNPGDTVYVYLNDNFPPILDLACYGNYFLGKAVVDDIGNWCLVYNIPPGIEFDTFNPSSEFGNDCISIYSVTPAIAGSYPNTSDFIECIYPNTPPQGVTPNIVIQQNCTENCISVSFTNDVGQTVNINCDAISWVLPDGGILEGCDNICADQSGTVTLLYSYQCQSYEHSFNIENIVMQMFVSATIASCNNADGSITVTVTGGTAPYIYSLNGQNSSPTDARTFQFSNLTSNTYNVTVFDSNTSGGGSGCSISQDIFVGSTPAPEIVAITNTPTACSGPTGTATVTITGGTAPFIYAINGSADVPSTDSTHTFIGLAEGLYLISIQDANDCTVTGVTTISIVQGPVIDSINTTATSCDINDGTIAVFASSGALPFIYTIDGQNPSPPTGNSYVFAGIGFGAYNIVVQDDNGCTFFSNVSVFRAESPVVSLEMEPATCGLSNGSVQSVVTNGTPPYEYQWSDGSQSDELLNVPGGFAGVTVTDSRGCMDTAFTDVSDIAGPSVISHTVTNATCSESDGSIELIITSGTAPYQYIISGESTVSPNTIFIFGDLAPGSYDIQIIDANNCMIDTSLTVGGGNIPVITSTFTAPVCNDNNGVITVFSADPDNLVYSMDGVLFQQSPDFTGLSLGTYQLFARDIIFGCISDTLIVEINSFSIDFDAINDTLIFNFQASPFKFNVITNDITPGNGMYTIRPVDRNVINEDGDLLGTVIKNNLDSFTLEYFYHGSFNSGANAYQLNYPDEDTRILYELCSEACPVACDTAEIIIRADIDCIDDNGGFINAITPNGDGRNDRLIIPDFPECNVRRSDIRIYDRWGACVFEAVNYQNDWEGKNSNGVDLPEATYYYVIRFRTDTSKEFVIKNFVEILR